MANGIKTGDPRGFNKGRNSKFHVGSRFRQTPEEGRRTYQPKRCGNKNKDEDNSPKTLNDKNHQALSQKFRQPIFLLCFFAYIFAIPLFLLFVGSFYSYIPLYTYVRTYFHYYVYNIPLHSHISSIQLFLSCYLFYYSFYLCVPECKIFL